MKGAVYGMGDVMSTAMGTYERRKLFFPITVDISKYKVAVYGISG